MPIKVAIVEDSREVREGLAYLVKNTPPAKIIEAIEDLHNGGSPMSNQIARRVLESARPGKAFSF